MPLQDLAWYTSSVGWTAVTAWSTGATKNAGDIVRQLAAPTVGNERTFVCTVGGTTHATTEPTWTITRGGKTTDNTVTWQEATGIAALNSDKTNTPTWNAVKNTAVVLGQVIQSVNGNFILICFTAGTAGNGAEPSWSAYTTAGATTADNTVTWVTLKDSGNNFAQLAAPSARLWIIGQNTWGGSSNGNKYFIADNSAETQTVAMALAFSGSTASLPAIVVSYDHTVGSFPPTTYLAGASISIGAAEAAINISGGNLYMTGITFNGETSGTNTAFNVNVNSSTTIHYYKSCAFNFRTTIGGAIIGNSFNMTVFDSCTWSWNGDANTAITQQQNSAVRYFNCTFSVPGTQPTRPLLGQSTMFQSTLFDSCDMSAFTGTLDQTAGSNYMQNWVWKNCKFNASATLPTAAAPGGVYAQGWWDSVGSDSSTAVIRMDKVRYEGTLTTETTIVRTGGATFNTTPFSWKIVTTANSKWTQPFYAPIMTIMNTLTGSSKTLTIFGVWNGGAVPNNDDLWIDVDYLGSASFTNTSRATSTKSSVISANSAYSSDTSTWGGGTTKFKMTVTFTPQMAGLVYVTVKCATASTTFYVDPQAVIT